MRRVSVDIGGTFTDCSLVWDDAYVEAKALTTHQNLALGFNASLKIAYEQLGLSLEEVMREVDSVRYATLAHCAFRASISSSMSCAGGWPGGRYSTSAR